MVHILVDNGSTHCFVDTALVKQLGMIVEMISPLMVYVVDGSKTVIDTACK